MESKLPFPGIRNKDAVLFPKKIGGRYVMLHRIEPDLCIAFSDDLEHWRDISSVMAPQVTGWDNSKIGVAGTPIKMNDYWMVIYHTASVWAVFTLAASFFGFREP